MRLLTLSFSVLCLGASEVCGEYCPAYYDYAHMLQPGFQCPAGVRLVGLSDYYCCRNDYVGDEVYCCNDRTKSINNSHLSYGQEWLIVNWPILLLLGMVFGFISVFSLTAPRIAEMKENEVEDV